MMVELKRMPFSEKFGRLLDTMQMEKDFIIPFIHARLDRHAVADLYNVWNNGVNLIPDNASFEDRYEIAYGNWIRMAKNSYRFIRQRMGDEGMEQFELAHIEALKQKNTGLSSAFLKVMRSVSQSSSFTFMARQILYEMQWLTPFIISEFSPDRVSIVIEQCKIHDFPDTGDLCSIGCQSSYSKWIVDQFRVNMIHNRHDNGCTCTLTPL